MMSGDHQTDHSLGQVLAGLAIGAVLYVYIARTPLYLRWVDVVLTAVGGGVALKLVKRDYESIDVSWGIAWAQGMAWQFFTLLLLHALTYRNWRFWVRSARYWFRAWSQTAVGGGSEAMSLKAAEDGPDAPLLSKRLYGSGSVAKDSAAAGPGGDDGGSGLHPYLVMGVLVVMWILLALSDKLAQHLDEMLSPDRKEPPDNF